jgi:hypothetical protein
LLFWHVVKQVPVAVVQFLIFYSFVCVLRHESPLLLAGKLVK